MFPMIIGSSKKNFLLRIAFSVGSEWESILKAESPAPYNWGRLVVVSVVINVTR